MKLTKNINIYPFLTVEDVVLCCGSPTASAFVGYPPRGLLWLTPLLQNKIEIFKYYMSISFYVMSKLLTVSITTFRHFTYCLFYVFFLPFSTFFFGPAF